MAAATGLAVAAQRLSPVLPATTLFRTRLLTGIVWTQASIGVAAILYNVPVSLGVLHQTGALTAWTAAFWLMHSLRPVNIALRSGAVPAVATTVATAAAATCLATTVETTRSKQAHAAEDDTVEEDDDTAAA